MSERTPIRYTYDPNSNTYTIPAAVLAQMFATVRENEKPTKKDTP